MEKYILEVEIQGSARVNGFYGEVGRAYSDPGVCGSSATAWAVVLVPFPADGVDVDKNTLDGCEIKCDKED